MPLAIPRPWTGHFYLAWPSVELVCVFFRFAISMFPKFSQNFPSPFPAYTARVPFNHRILLRLHAFCAVLVLERGRCPKLSVSSRSPLPRCLWTRSPAALRTEPTCLMHQELGFQHLGGCREQYSGLNWSPVETILWGEILWFFRVPWHLNLSKNIPSAGFFWKLKTIFCFFLFDGNLYKRRQPRLYGNTLKNQTFDAECFPTVPSWSAATALGIALDSTCMVHSVHSVHSLQPRWSTGSKPSMALSSKNETKSKKCKNCKNSNSQIF